MPCETTLPLRALEQRSALSGEAGSRYAGSSRRAKPLLSGEARPVVVGWEEEAADEEVFLALVGVLVVGLGREEPVAKRERGKKGPGAGVWC